MHFLNPSSGWIYSKPRYTPSRDAIFDIRWVALRWVVVAENPGAFLSRYVVIHRNVGYVVTIRDGRHLPLGPNRIRSFDNYKQKENKFNHEKKNNKIEKHVQTASGSRPPRFSVATWINSWSSHSTQSHSCRMVGFAARNGGDGWGGRPFVARTRSPVETARVNGFPRLVVIPQGIAEGNDTSHGRKPWSQRGACRPLIAAPTGSRGRMDWQSLDKQELW